MSNGISIRKVAERAGVSTATVSRVINGHNAVAEDTRAQVQAVIEELDYQPDPKLGQFFKSLNGGIRGVAFALHPDLHTRISSASDPFYARMSLAVQAELSKHSRHMVLANSGTDSTSNGNLTCVAQGLCNGVIGELKQPAFIARLASHTPVVLLNADYDIPFVDVVIPHVERAAHQQLRFLTKLGHRSIACFRPRSTRHGEPLVAWQDKRFWHAYTTFHEAHHVHLPPVYLESSMCDDGQHAAAVHEFLDNVFANNAIAPTAILTYDGYAGELIRQLGERGFDVPHDVSIIGYDDYTFGHPCPLGLTTFRQDFEAMAKHAVDLLLARIQEPERPAVLLQVEGQLIERESTAPSPTPNRSAEKPKGDRYETSQLEKTSLRRAVVQCR
ncbi:MAG: LacI family transcriptional regulator [Candidatus Pacebacteria bacterium]|nr:LacI family transcriptional regulator [Candidatus Paceibacterota bacterium]